MKRVRALLMGLAATAIFSFGLAGTASAADTGPNGEKTSASMTLEPRSGSLYKAGDVAGNWRINVEVTEPFVAMTPAQDIYPLKKVSLQLPTDLSFDPKANMAVCPDNMVGPPPVNMSKPPQEVIDRCPKSVLGNGTADLYLGHKNLPSGPNLKDPVLIVFNAGTTPSGLAKIKIYGYSKGTTAGIFMQGVLQDDGSLDISVPVLSSDSAVGRFDLRIPGSTPIDYNGSPVPQSVGQDLTYVKARCSTGNWAMKSKFTLGTREDDGTPISADYVVDAPDWAGQCEGKAGKPPVTGKPKIAKVTVKGPAKAKRGKKVTYRVTVRNSGAVAAKGVKITAKGKGAKGSVKVGNVKAKGSKTVKVKVKFTKKGKSKVTFTAKGKGAGSAKGAKTVRVK